MDDILKRFYSVTCNPGYFTISPFSWRYLRTLVFRIDCSANFQGSPNSKRIGMSMDLWSLFLDAIDDWVYGWVQSGPRLNSYIFYKIYSNKYDISKLYLIMVLKRPCGMCVGRVCVPRDSSCWVNTTEIPLSSRKKRTLYRSSPDFVCWIPVSTLKITWTWTVCILDRVNQFQFNILGTCPQESTMVPASNCPATHNLAWFGFCIVVVSYCNRWITFSRCKENSQKCLCFPLEWSAATEIFCSLFFPNA